MCYLMNSIKVKALTLCYLINYIKGADTAIELT